MHLSKTHLPSPNCSSVRGEVDVFAFNLRKELCEKLQEVVIKERSRSAPGPLINFTSTALSVRFRIILYRGRELRQRRFVETEAWFPKEDEEYLPIWNHLPAQTQRETLC